MLAIALLFSFSQLLFTHYATCQFIGSYSPATTPLPCPWTRPFNSANLSPAPYKEASQIGEWYNNGLFNVATLAASNGGDLLTTSSSPLAPNGVSISSEIAIQGGLTVIGAVPFLGAVALEGALLTGGAGSIGYGCGNGNVAILSEDTINSDAGVLGYDNENVSCGGRKLGYGASAFNYDPGLAGASYGYNGANIGLNRACGWNTLL